jgi:hypothetical protein
MTLAVRAQATSTSGATGHSTTSALESEDYESTQPCGIQTPRSYASGAANRARLNRLGVEWASDPRTATFENGAARAARAASACDWRGADRGADRGRAGGCAPGRPGGVARDGRSDRPSREPAPLLRDGHHGVAPGVVRSSGRRLTHPDIDARPFVRAVWVLNGSCRPSRHRVTLTRCASQPAWLSYADERT